MVREKPLGRLLETIRVEPEGLTANPCVASPAGYWGPAGATIRPPGRIEGPTRFKTGRMPAGAAYDCAKSVGAKKLARTIAPGRTRPRYPPQFPYFRPLQNQRFQRKLLTTTVLSRGGMVRKSYLIQIGMNLTALQKGSCKFSLTSGSTVPYIQLRGQYPLYS